jgi:hypothetical protein
VTFKVYDKDEFMFSEVPIMRSTIQSLLLVVVTVVATSSFSLQASVLAPPADFDAFAKQADVIVTGTFTGVTKRAWTKGRYPKTLTDMHFTVTSAVKQDARLAGKEVVVTTDSPDEEIVAKFAKGETYTVFLKWDDHFQIYSLSYGLASAYHLVGTNAVPMQPNTALAQKHGPLSVSRLETLARAVAAR